MFLIVSFLLVWLCYRFANIIFTLSPATTIFQCNRSSLFSQFNICFFIVFVCFFISCFFLFANKSIGRRKQEWCFFIFIDCSVLFCFAIWFVHIPEKNSNKTKHVTEELTLSSYKQRQVGKERTIFSSVTFVWFSISSFILNTMIIWNNNSRNVSIEPLKYRIIN